MPELAPNTPVVIGIGFHQVKSDVPSDCPEAIELMRIAIEDAARDAGAAEMVKDFKSISVLKGSWQYNNPGKLLADKLGATQAKSYMSEIGVLQILPILELAQEISDGKQDIGVVVGGEARFRDLRSLITGEPVTDTQEPEGFPEPDEFYRTPDAFSSDLEAARGVWAPGEFYAIAESAIRYHEGLTIEAHKDKIANLYAGFSEIAASNPHAWITSAASADELKTVNKKNGMIAFPYTKRIMSQWNVNQSVAIIMCSYEKAQSLDLDDRAWIYPLSGAQQRNVVNLAQKPTLHTHPGTVMTGERALAIAHLSVDDLARAELYSPFASAVQAGIKDLKLEGKSISATGSMAFAGGPFNHGAVDSVARLVEILREQKAKGIQEKAIVTSISGMFGKQGCGIFSTEPAQHTFLFDDVTDAVKAVEIPIELDDVYQGEATIVAYSVMYNKADISHAIAYCDTPEGKRTVVRTGNITLAEQMMAEEFIGKKVQVLAEGDFCLM